MFDKLTGSSISKIKNPYGRLTVLAVIALAAAVTSLFWLLRGDRSETISEYRTEIRVLKEEKEKERHRADSLIIVAEELRVYNAMMQAKTNVNQLNQVNEFNKILDNLKKQIRK